MLDLIRKSLYAGIGASVVTMEKVESVLDEFVEKGKLSADEAKAAAEKIANEGKKEFDDASNSLRDMIEDVLKKAPIAQKSDMEAIKKRLDGLEAEIQDSKKSS